MDLQFRPITDAEVAAFCRLVDRAYAAKVQQLYGNSSRGRWRHYGEARVRTFISREAEGVRAGFDGNDMLCACSCRSHGSLGWFHTLAVHPRVQGRGVGRQAVLDAERYLGQRGVRTIALMTWPDAIDNLVFYQKLGYRSVGLSLNVIRQVQPELSRADTDLQANLLSQQPLSEQERCLGLARRLSQRSLPGLDYTAWMMWTLSQSASDVMLFWQQRRLVGFAIAEHYPQASWLAVRLLLLAPALAAEGQLAAIERLRQWAQAQRFSYFGFPLDLLAPTANQLVQSLGFRLFRDTMVDCVKGDLWPPQGLQLVRFSG
ncbi:MAG: GNAT family N-acetyltransferase [Chloroflexi bacterium]|nr:GNAT family N-acetyltransferase [Chloroflexota bacterium]